MREESVDRGIFPLHKEEPQLDPEPLWTDLITFTNYASVEHDPWAAAEFQRCAKNRCVKQLQDEAPANDNVQEVPLLTKLVFVVTERAVIYRRTKKTRATLQKIIVMDTT